jgi:hypothetical protein
MSGSLPLSALGSLTMDQKAILFDDLIAGIQGNSDLTALLLAMVLAKDKRHSVSPGPESQTAAIKSSAAASRCLPTHAFRCVPMQHASNPSASEANARLLAACLQMEADELAARELQDAETQQRIDSWALAQELERQEIQLEEDAKYAAKLADEWGTHPIPRK